MEKGIVKSFDKDCGVGMIGRAFEMDVRFYAESIIERGRAGLAQGDAVWFEVNPIKNLRIATNIQKCN